MLFWIIGILFPVAFIGRFWPSFGHVFDTVFSPGWMHILMHMFLFAGLSFLVGQWLRPVSNIKIAQIVGIALLVGCLQEGIQISTYPAWPGWEAEALDLLVDLFGAALGIFIAKRMLVRKNITTKQNQSPE